MNYEPVEYRDLCPDRASIIVAGRNAVLDAQLAVAVDPQAIVAELRQVAALPLGAKAYATAGPANLQRLEAIAIPHGAGAADQRRVGRTRAAELRQPGARRLAAAAACATHHVEARRNESADQPGLVKDRVRGAADQRAEVVQVQPEVAAGEIVGRSMIVLEAAIRQQRAAIAREQAELAIEQEIAAVKRDIVAAPDHRRAVLAVLAEHAPEDVQRRQDAAVAAMRERRPIALVAAEIAVEDLPLEHVSH